jgi:hypothetical protein
MQNNLFFYNIDEAEEEDCGEMIYSLLEKLDMPEAKFNFFPDQEKISFNAKK